RQADHIPTCLPGRTPQSTTYYCIMGDPLKRFKDLFRRGRKNKSGDQSRGNASREDTPSPNASIRGTSPPPTPSVGVSALVFQPFVPLPVSLPPVPRKADPAAGGNDTWTNLTAFVSLLHRDHIFGPLAAVMDDLSWFIREHENVVTAQDEYRELYTQLEVLFKDLLVHFSTGTPPVMTTSMLNLCAAIGTELRQVYGTQDRNAISKLLQAEHDLDKITRCYRRIQTHLDRVMVNATLNVLRIVDTEKTEARLLRLAPSLSACYNSAEARVVQRRECTPNTRKQVLLDLNTWKDKTDGRKVCWMSGMAGTGKTTITNTLCSTLDQNYELGASFFCTRSLPACRDVKLILPTIAYQLARFSGPFRGALVHVLDRDPDVHTKALRVQFQRMILEPLQDVRGSLPNNLVVVIDALDECDDGNGVEQILEVLLEKASELPVKFLVSSRPEYHIRDRISRSVQKTQVTLHELEERIVKADIETYLRAEAVLLSIPLTEGQLETLVERAGVLFIYAATVIRYITDGDPLERLDTVLRAPDPGQEPSNKSKEIDGLYEAVLASAFGNPRLERLEKQRMELVLHTIVCVQEPLTIEALSGLLELSSTKVIAALRPLWFFAAGTWKRIIIWDTSSCRMTIDPILGHSDSVKSIAISPDGTLICSGSYDETVRIWDAQNGQLVASPLEGHNDKVASVSFSPDGQWLVTGLWVCGQEYGGLLASGSWDETIRLWSLVTGTPVGSPFEGHTDVIRSVAFSPSGKHLVSGSDDMTLRIWDVMGGQSIATFQGHTDRVLSVAFSPNATQIVSGSADAAIRLWNAPEQCFYGILSSSYVGSEASEKRLVNVEEGYLEPEWDMDNDGWVRDAQNRLLVWVPPDLRTALLRRHNSGLISRQGCIDLELVNARIGDEWQTCYEPFPPAAR
ncbi:unnamed protein product, partial [Rhizoctonia solani]